MEGRRESSSAYPSRQVNYHLSNVPISVQVCITRRVGGEGGGRRTTQWRIERAILRIYISRRVERKRLSTTKRRPLAQIPSFLVPQPSLLEENINNAIKRSHGELGLLSIIARARSPPGRGEVWPSACTAHTHTGSGVETLERRRGLFIAPTRPGVTFKRATTKEGFKCPLSRSRSAILSSATSLLTG